MPKISVIMPAYNAEKYIAEAIESILGQTFGDFEFIILNDCSTDRTEEIIRSYTDSRIVYLKNEQNMGVAATLNRGLSVAKGEYIARMDADDISLPERFEKQVAFLDKDPAVAVLGTGLERFDASGSLGILQPATDPEQMHIDLLFSCGLAHPSVMMRASAVRELGGYDLAFEGLEDYELWCRVARKYQVTTLPEVLLRYRIHSAQVTKKPSEAYFARLRRLKEKQLQWLNLPTQGAKAECYFAFCCSEQVDFWLLTEFFRDVINADTDYDPELLKRNVQGILTGLAAKLPFCQRVQVGKTRLITPLAVSAHRGKFAVKRLLGR